MTTETDILAAVKDQLNKLYSYPVYLDEVKEGFKQPCFFLKSMDVAKEETKYVEYHDVSVYITYFPKKNDDMLAMYDVKDSLKSAFIHGLSVGSRYLHFITIQTETNGQDSDILLITLRTQYYDSIGKEEPTYKMLHLYDKIH